MFMILLFFFFFYWNPLKAVDSGRVVNVLIRINPQNYPLLGVSIACYGASKILY